MVTKKIDKDIRMQRVVCVCVCVSEATILADEILAVLMTCLLDIKISSTQYLT